MLPYRHFVYLVMIGCHLLGQLLPFHSGKHVDETKVEENKTNCEADVESDGTM